jgi:3-isopropylmalate/(R)-2-methylmalate dehydratase small subunit
MTITGTAWKFAQDDINTDLIQRTVIMHLPLAEQAKLCLDTIDPSFASKVQPGDIVVAGHNFGCGSSRPAHAVLKALGLAAIIAESFGRAFFRSSISGGLLVARCPGILELVATGDRIELDGALGQVKNLTSGKSLTFTPLPRFLHDMAQCGGEMPYLKARLAREAGTPPA